MSFFNPELHDIQQHAAFFEYTTLQGPLCLACLLHSLADAAQLDSRKTFMLREFVRVFGPEGSDGAEPLRQLLSQHAPTLVDGLLTACAASQDVGMGAAVQEAAAAMCSCAPEYLPELLTERILQQLLDLHWPDIPSLPDLQNPHLDHQNPQAIAYAAAAVSCCLSMLHHTISTYPAAARLAAGALAQSQELGAVLCAGLSCPLAPVVTPLLHVFAVLAGGSPNTAVVAASLDVGSSSGACTLPPGVVRELFIRLLLLAPQLSSADLRGLLLQVLLHLVATGYAVEHASLPPKQPSTAAAAPLLTAQTASQFSAGLSQQQPYSQQPYSQQPHQHTQQQVEQHSAALAGAIVSGLKAALLDTDPSLQLQACRLLAAAAARAPALLLQQLIAADCCEHLFEVLRGTLSSCSMGASILALQQQRQQGQGGAAAVAVVTEDLHAAAVSALQCISTQGPHFQEHLHFGLDTLTDLLHHANTTCNSPLLSTIVALLCTTLSPPQQHQHAAGSSSNSASSSASLPAAALGRLAAAVAAVLPAVSPEEAAAAGSHGAAGAGLQPTPELQQSYELSCRLLSLLCSTYCLTETRTTAFTTSSSKASAAKAVAPHILSAAQKALLALPLLSSRVVVSGFLTAAAELLVHAVQLLATPLAAASAAAGSSSSQKQQHGQPGLPMQHRTGQAGKPGALPDPKQQQQQQQQQQLRGKGTGQKGSSKGTQQQKKGKQGRQAASQDKLFTRSTQQQQQQQQQAGQQQQGSGGLATDAEQQGLLDDLLCLLEGVLQYLMPAAVRGWDALGLADAAAAAGAGMGAWPAAEVQEEQQAAVAMLQGVLRVLQAVMDAGVSCALLSPFLPAFCQQLLSSSGVSWTSVCLDLLSLLPLPAGLAAEAWRVLLLAAVQVQGPTFMPGPAPNLAPVATSLAARVHSRLSLLELLCSSPAQHHSSTSNSTQQGAAAAQPHHGSGDSGGGSRRTGSSSRHGSGDIRRFCGVSELHKAALCVVAAALYSGDICWDLGDVLTAVDAAVSHAGPAVLAQPEVLLNIVRLYAQVEQQLLSDLQQQQVLQVPAAAAAAMGQPGEGAGMGIRPALPPPAAIVGALERASAAQLASLHPNDVAAGWVLGQAGVLPGAVRLLLQSWMQLLLAWPAAQADVPSAAAGDTGLDAAAQQQQQQQRRHEQQQELCQALLAALQQQPAALTAVLQLLQDLLDPQQQQLQGQGQAPAAWLAVLTAVLHSSTEQLTAVLTCQAQQQASLLPSGDHSGADKDTASTCSTLQQLLLGTGCSRFTGAATTARAAAAAGAGGFPGGSNSSSSLLQLTRKVLMSACIGGSWGGSWGSCHLLLACCNCLTAVAAAVSAGAAAAVGGGGTDHREQEQWLLQQGVQQVALLATRWQQLPAEHQMHQALTAAAANAAAAWLHTCSVSAADAELLQQLAGNSVVNILMQEAAAAALGPTQQQQQQQQQRSEAVSLQLPPQTSTEAALAQLWVGLWQKCGLLPPAASDLGGGVGCDSTQALFCSSSSSDSSRALLLTPALVWDISSLWLQLAVLGSGHAGTQQQQQQQQLAGIGGGSSSDGQQPGRRLREALGSSGLSLQHMMLLLQSQGPCLLSLLLLDNITQLLLQQQQQGEQQLWPVCLTVLQNAVAAATVPGACSWQYTAAAVSCLTALYAAAESSYSSSSSSSGVGSAAMVSAVTSSPWNSAVVKAAAERVCQRGLELKAAAAAAMAAEAGSNGAFRLSYRWLSGSETQQCCQLFCADAQLLLTYLNLAATAAESAAGSSNAASSRRAVCLQQLQTLLLPYLEQQQLMAVLCWGAGQCYSCCQALLQEEEDHQQQQQGSGQLLSQGVLAHKAAACCLCMQLSGVCLSLLEALVLSGCCSTQVARLKQQLQQQQQAILMSQQQQQGCDQSFGGASAVDRGLEGFAAQCVSVGALQALAPVQVVGGSAVGRVTGAGLQLLAQEYGGSQSLSPVPRVCEPLEVVARLQQLLQHLQRS